MSSPEVGSRVPTPRAATPADVVGLTRSGPDDDGRDAQVSAAMERLSESVRRLEEMPASQDDEHGQDNVALVLKAGQDVHEALQQRLNEAAG